MTDSHKKNFFLALALVLSIGLNAYLLVRSGRSATPESARTGRTGPSDRRCRAELARLNKQSWELVVRLLAARGAPLHRPPSDPAASVPERKPPPEDQDVDLDDQREALCDIARSDLYNRWRNRRDQAAEDLRRSLENREKLEQDLIKDTDEFAHVLDLSRTDRDRLLSEYRTARTKRMEAALAALNQDPPDHMALFEEARDLFADEDRMVRRLFGEKAELALRRSQTRKRTVILALLAAHAGLPWDDGIAW